MTAPELTDAACDAIGERVHAELVGAAGMRYDEWNDAIDRALIRAGAASVPPSVQAVPREPTEAMLEAVSKYYGPRFYDIPVNIEELWSIMYDAAIAQEGK